jgi:cell division protein FtsX
MRAIDYALRHAWASFWRSGTSTAFAVLAIALAAMVLGTLLLVTWNVDRVMAQWTDATEFSIFLRDDATSEQRGAVETAIDQSGVSDRREYVSKTQALTRFRNQFADLASLTDDFDDNPFPASVEVRVRPDAARIGRADTLVRSLARRRRALRPRMAYPNVDGPRRGTPRWIRARLVDGVCGGGDRRRGGAARTLRAYR